MVATLTVAHDTIEPLGKELQTILQTSVAYNDELYQRVYCRMYDRLKPLYDEIRDITGYPPKN
ncbi:MAG: hypothetical protein KBF64_03865 [Anaerolineaceae bacterium]|nr:hypothetical protein [Anaerolineaceae bacterium]